MKYNYLKVRISDHIATCIISNPPRYTITESGVKELIEFVNSLEQDSSVRILTLTGESDTIFIAHYELNELAETSEKQQHKKAVTDETPRELSPMNRLCLNLENSRLITIAALNGQAHGGGWEISLACDFRLAKKGSYKLGLPETNVGIIPGAGGTQRMARLLGTAKALDIILHGRLMTPEQAFSMGLIHRLYDEASFTDEVAGFAQRLAERSPIALSAAKRAIQQGIHATDMEEALLIEQECFNRAMQSEDAAGAMRAWLKGEKYHWEGR